MARTSTRSRTVTARDKEAPKRRAGRPPAPPAATKEALRAQVEKLTRANTVLRARNRALKQEAGDAAERVATLEAELRRLERRASRQNASRREDAGPARGRRRAERDPGDAVPPGVAVQEPAPLSDADRAVLEHLEETLAPD